jgi:hypothetical protein
MDCLNGGWIRAQNGTAVWMQNVGPSGDPHEPELARWQIFSVMDRALLI